MDAYVDDWRPNLKDLTIWFLQSIIIEKKSGNFNSYVRAQSGGDWPHGGAIKKTTTKKYIKKAIATQQSVQLT